MFANLTADENRALFTKLAGAGHAIDILTGTLMGCQQHAGAFLAYIDIWGEINAIRHDLNDQRPWPGRDTLSGPVIKWARLNTINPSLIDPDLAFYDEEISAAGLNDSGHTFAEIADLIDGGA